MDAMRILRGMTLASLVWMAGLAPQAHAGDGTCGIFVATTGADVPGSGLAPVDPCQTISFGIQRAVEEGLSCVFVQAGTYNEIIELASGVNIDGGYDTAWVRDSYAEREHMVMIVGGLHAGSGQYMTVRAVGLNATTQISNLNIIGPHASGAGLSSYAVYANNSDRLVLHEVRIDGGNGAAGAPGSAGMDATLNPVGAMHGQTGGNGASVFSCDSSSFGVGGNGGVSPSCPSGSNGGKGGNGGNADTNCGFPPDTDANPGQGGQPGANSGGGFGGGGPGAPTCLSGVDGEPGRVQNGFAGSPASGGTGTAIGGFWAGSMGTAGGTGTTGGGGGGGGGAGGCDTGTDYYGAGGGGGGAGGCPGTGGAAGGAGGASFGVFAVNSVVQVDECIINRGNGGAGGAGGVGGRGQIGGSGGLGGATPSGATGGNGGIGGHGGHGGGGAGGAGGISAAVYCANSSVTNLISSIIGGGAGGSGGPGGISAPGAPPQIDDGNDGPNGPNGLVIASINCNAAAPVAHAMCDPSPCLGGPCVGDCPGACCINGAAVTLLESECDAVGGAYMGNGTLPGEVKCAGTCIADMVSNLTFAPPGDGVVDAADLAYLLGEWGRCR